jgi:hypothetical protein
VPTTLKPAAPPLNLFLPPVGALTVAGFWSVEGGVEGVEALGVEAMGECWVRRLWEEDDGRVSCWVWWRRVLRVERTGRWLVRCEI